MTNKELINENIGFACTFCAISVGMVSSELEDHPISVFMKVIGSILAIIGIVIYVYFIVRDMKQSKMKINARYKEATKHVKFAVDDSPKAIANYETYYAAPRFTRRTKR